LLRRAIQTAPTNAEPWYELSSMIHVRCVLDLGFQSDFSGDDLLDTITRKANIDLLRKLEPASNEALYAANQAVKFDPDRADFYRKRASCRVLDNLLKLRLSGKPIDQSNAMDAGWSQDILADFKRTAELDPDNPDSVHAVLMYEMARSNFRSPTFDWPAFQTNNQALINATLTQLDRLSKSTNTPTALAALRLIITTEFLQTNYVRIAEACRDIVRIDPSDDAAWNSRVATLVRVGRFDEAIAAADQRLKLRDAPQNRLFLAQALEAARKWNDAQSNVRKAVEMGPDDVQANLALAVVLLKEGKSAEARAIIEKYQDTTEYADKLAYVQGLYWAMKGSRVMARTHLEKVLALDPASNRAAELLKLVLGDKTSQ
jgi:tetratricopeptide (TPR) repeat protein